MLNGITVKHGWILLLLMINGELVIEWKKEKSIQCEDFDEDTGEKEYTMLWKQK